MTPGIVTVRPFVEEDLDAAAELCERARGKDSSVEPFAQRLAVIATGPRALLDLWRVAEGEDGRLHGIAFAALRETRAAQGRKQPADLRGSQPASAELYAAVDPPLRRQGLGRQLVEPALAWLQAAEGPVALRGRILDAPESAAGRGFLSSLGFAQAAALLSLGWSGARPPAPREVPDLSLRLLERRDRRGLAEVVGLSERAWEGAPDSFSSRSDEMAQILAELDRLTILASLSSAPAGYLSALWLGRTLAIDEVAVLPEFRRVGVARALVVEALARSQAPQAVLSVSEKNGAARALYQSLGFTQRSRRLILELRGGHG